MSYTLEKVLNLSKQIDEALATETDPDQKAMYETMLDSLQFHASFLRAPDVKIYLQAGSVFQIKCSSAQAFADTTFTVYDKGHSFELVPIMESTNG